MARRRKHSIMPNMSQVPDVNDATDEPTLDRNSAIFNSVMHRIGVFGHVQTLSETDCAAQPANLLILISETASCNIRTVGGLPRAWYEC